MVITVAFCLYFIAIISYLSLLSLSVGSVSAILRYKKGDGFEAFMASLCSAVKRSMYVFIILGIFFFFVLWMGYGLPPMVYTPQ